MEERKKIDRRNRKKMETREREREKDRGERTGRKKKRNGINGFKEEEVKRCKSFRNKVKNK